MEGPNHMSLYNKRPEIYGKFGKNSFRNSFETYQRDYISAMAIKNSAGEYMSHFRCFYHSNSTTHHSPNTSQVVQIFQARLLMIRCLRMSMTLEVEMAWRLMVLVPVIMPLQQTRHFFHIYCGSGKTVEPTSTSPSDSFYHLDVVQRILQQQSSQVGGQLRSPMPGLTLCFSPLNFWPYTPLHLES